MSEEFPVCMLEGAEPGFKPKFLPTIDYRAVHASVIL